MKKSLYLIFLVPVILGQGCFSNQAPRVSPAPQEIQETPGSTSQPVAQTVGVKIREIKTSGSRPTARQLSAAAYDSVINVMYVFGGRDANGYTNDLYQLDLGTNKWELISSGTGPSPRYGTPLMIDAPRSRLYLFGGQGDDGAFLDDFWMFDLSSRTWEQIKKDVQPVGRYGHGGIYDEKNRGPVIFGGFVSGGRSNEIWRFNLDKTDARKDAWVNLSPDQTTRPQARCLVGYSHASGDDSFWLFGGQSTGIPGGKPYLGDFWRFDFNTNQWLSLKTAEGMPARHWGGLAALNDQVILFGGESAEGTLNDLWIYDEAANGWARFDGSQIPARTGHAIVSDAASNEAIIFGGSSSDRELLNDVWAIEVVSK